MSKPYLPYYDLEFASDALFWSGEEASERRIFLMPSSPPSKFVGFGVARASREACFVARGTVVDHLGHFISRNVREGVRVELYVKPPLPQWLLERYTTNPPWEGHEYESPPNPPVSGLVATGVKRYAPSPTGALWSEGDGSNRVAFIIPMHDAAEFLAFGMLGSRAEEHFIRVGRVENQLGDFIEQMKREEARVELRAMPPLPEPRLRRYLPR
ncbi:hypothetical protein JY651_50460 [Pyxidicoccus parkwayensis]|uniref:Suppressor of fused-like domain-containing protein n=1 Tax=Pyxidicoccus parkwayensis TaxID=2813578 RepID=A0ABX7P0K9_9BACT|nr:hypothetical protein [Pyxidicoccus parkwaysis]QSQ23215.1 hypothetical protein JY651_50460 [Pyxidicoccus parkwaysis]